MSIGNAGTADAADTIDEFAAAVGAQGSVTVAGHGTRGGPVADVRCVKAPAGVWTIEPAEMTIRCGAGTPVDEIDRALAAHGQCVAVPPGGTIGGALAVGRSGIRRLGHGPVRDTVLQVRYVDANGAVVKAGGPTVKNVSGFDLCRLLVGSHGTLGFLAEVILRTRPRPMTEQWFTSSRDPWELLAGLYRPTSVLWNGERCWVLLEGHPDDVAAQADRHGLTAVDGPPDLPAGGRWSMAPVALTDLRDHDVASFVAEIGVGVVHHRRAAPPRTPDPVIAELHRRIKHEFDPDGRLNPGVGDVLIASTAV